MIFAKWATYKDVLALGTVEKVSELGCDATCVLVYVNGTFAGWGALNDGARVGPVCVVEGYENAGVEELIIRMTIRRAFENGCGGCAVVISKDAEHARQLKLYYSLGFEKTDETDAVVYLKREGDVGGQCEN